MVKSVVPDHMGHVATQVVDVSKEADVEAAVNAVEPWGGVDVMFNMLASCIPKMAIQRSVPMTSGT